MRSLGCLLVPFVTLASACGGRTGPAGNTVDAVPALSATEELRIGSADDPDIGFSRIAGITVGANGRVYVLDSQEHEIRVYGADGSRLDAFGREGEGPGEFRLPSRLGTAGDTLWVTDAMRRVVSLFDAGGRFLGVIRLPTWNIQLLPTLPGLLMGDGLRDDGWIHGTWGMVLLRDMPADTLWLPHTRIDRTGTTVDTVWLQPYVYPSDRQRIAVGGREVYPPSPPDASPLFVDADDEWYAVERPVATAAGSATFTVTRVSGMADTLWQRAFTYRPRTFTEEALDSLVESRVASYQRSGELDADAAAAAFRAALSPPAFFPPISSGRLASDGMLWLRREDEPGSPARWLLIRPDGEPAGTLELPRAATVHWSAGPVVWAALRDDLDIPWLVRYRLTGLAP